MINVSNEFKQQILNDKRLYVNQIYITLRDGTELPVITNKSIWEGSLKLENSVSSSDSFDIGAAVIGKLSFTLNNIYEEFTQYDFEQAVVRYGLGLELSDGTKEFINKGVYIVEEATCSDSFITLECLDYMSRFDKPYSESKISYPATLGAIVRDACTVCEVPLGSAVFENDDYMVREKPDDEALTFRQVLLWAGQICCKWWKCSPSGELVCGWYDTAAFEGMENTIQGGVFDDGEPFYNSGSQADGGSFAAYFEENNYNGGIFAGSRNYHMISHLSSQNIRNSDVVITGVRVMENGEEEAFYQSGNDGYVIGIEGNQFIQTGDGAEVAAFIGTRVNGMRFRPLSVNCLSDPTIEAGDCAVVTDRKGMEYCCYITNTTFSIGEYQLVSCDAKTPSKQEAAKYSSGASLYTKTKKLIQKERTQREIAIEKLANALADSGGLYITTQEQTDHSLVYYAHNKQVMEESDIIWKFTAEAIGISTDGGKTWPYGFSVTGEMITRVLQSEGVNADWITTGALAVRDSKGTEVFYADMDSGVVRVNADSISIKGKDVGAALKKFEEDKNGNYYGNYIPTLSNEPANRWNDEYEKHNGDSYTDVSTGDVYIFKSGTPGLELTFSKKSKTESTSYDYVEIYIQENNIYKSIGKFGGDDISEKRVLIPATTFWLYWKTDVSNDKYFGFSIENIRNVIVSDKEYQALRKTLPQGTAIDLTGSNYPESEHLPYGNGVSCLWKYTGTSSTVRNGWVKMPKILTKDVKDTLDQDVVMNILTDEGRIKGLFMDGDELYMNATYIKSGTLTLGGSEDQYGTLRILDESSKVIGRWDKDGIYVDNGTLHSKTSTTSIGIYGGRMNVSHGGTNVGYIGTNVMSGYPNNKGLVFDLEADGSYMTWAAKETVGANTYYAKLLYANMDFNGYKKDTMYFGCDVDMCNYVIKDVGLQNVHGINGWKTWTGSIPIYFKRGDDYYTSSIDVENGIIIAAPRM